MKATYISKSTGKRVDLLISKIDEQSVSFETGGGRMLQTLSRKEFDARYEPVDKRPPAASSPTSPAPSGFDPELGAPRPRPGAPGGPIDARIDDILGRLNQLVPAFRQLSSQVEGLDAKVGAIFRIVVAQPHDDDDAPPAPPASSQPTG